MKLRISPYPVQRSDKSLIFPYGMNRQIIQDNTDNRKNHGSGRSERNFHIGNMIKFSQINIREYGIYHDITYKQYGAENRET